MYPHPCLSAFRTHTLCHAVLLKCLLRSGSKAPGNMYEGNRKFLLYAGYFLGYSGFHFLKCRALCMFIIKLVAYRNHPLHFSLIELMLAFSL